MKKYCALIGTLVMLLAPSQLIAQESPYKDLLEITKHEFSFADAEPEVVQFVKTIYPDRERNPLDVNTALKEYLNTICGGLSQGACPQPLQFARDYVNKEARIRTLGRDLQIIATSYELPIHTFPDKPLSSALRMASVQKLWQATNEPLTAPVSIATLFADVLPWDDMASEVDKLSQEIPGQGEEKTGAIWRYLHGFATLEKTEGTCSGSMEELDGTELQFTRKRWCNIEEALKAVLERAQQEMDMEIIGNNDAIFSTKEVGDGIFVWVTKDEAGLAWEFPLEPVLPSLDCSQSGQQPPECVNGVILGGVYPPVPEDPKPGSGLCARPIAKQGYLCTPVPQESCDEETDSDTITLTKCTGGHMQDEMPVAYSEAGPGICTTGGWRDEPEGEIPESCNQCILNDETIECGCSDGDSETYGGALSAKEADGKVPVCIGTEGGIPGSYLQLKQMVLAQKACGLPPGAPLYETQETCCATEYSAALAMCNAIGLDGNFSGDFADITVEACAAAVADESCTRAEYDTCSEGLPEGLLARIEQAAAQNVAEVAGCSAQADDPRNKAVLQSLPLVCNPQCQAAYGNTIGNNLCYSGQCIELSLEAHRLIPGRSPFVSTEEAFPWDACMQEIPPQDAASIGQLPAPFLTRFPRYQPRLLIESLDRALCQINGLPALTPPILCTFDTNRRLDIPLVEYSDITRSLIDQPQEYDFPADALENIATSVGARVGTDMYTQYLSVATRILADLSGYAVQLLQYSQDIQFPMMMCPRDAESCIASSSSSSSSE